MLSLLDNAKGKSGAIFKIQYSEGVQVVCVGVCVYTRCAADSFQQSKVIFDDMNSKNNITQ